VSDIPRAIKFYQEVLGFRVAATIEDPPATFALMMRDGAELALGRGVNPTRSGFYAYVEGVEELHRGLVEAGTDATPLTTQPWGLRDFVLHDPDGHMVAIGERVAGSDH